MALICAVLANSHRDSKKRAYRISDFMPRLATKSEKEEKKKQTPAQMLEMVRAWNAAVGGKEVRKDGN